MKKIIKDNAPFLFCAFMTCLMIRIIVLPGVPKIPPQVELLHKSAYDLQIKLNHQGTLENRNSGYINNR